MAQRRTKAIVSRKQKMFLDEQWQVLEMHYLKHYTVRQIAVLAGKRVSSVYEIPVEAWELELDFVTVRDYLRRDIA